VIGALRFQLVSDYFVNQFIRLDLGIRSSGRRLR
jgi:hypothetical protein